MKELYSTRQVAGLLDVKPDTLQKAIWQNRINPPAKGPGGAYFWTEADIEHASWALLHRAYEPSNNPKNIEHKREEQINKLLVASTPEERKRIIEACREGQALRQELEQQSNGKFNDGEV